MACTSLASKQANACTSGIAKVRDPILLKQIIAQNLCQGSLSPATGPIAESSLITFTSSAFASAYVTGSISPASNALLLATVVTGRDLGVPTTPTLSGNGLTWVQIQSGGSGANNALITVFRALGLASAGALTVDYGGVSQDACEVNVLQFTNVNTSGTNGSGAVVQSSIAGPVTGASIGPVLAAFNANGNNAGFIASGKNSVNPFGGTPKAFWIEVADDGITSVAHGTNYGIWTGYRLATTDNAPTVSFTFTGAVWAVGVEIKSVLS